MPGSDKIKMFTSQISFFSFRTNLLFCQFNNVLFQILNITDDDDLDGWNINTLSPRHDLNDEFELKKVRLHTNLSSEVFSSNSF